MKTLVSMLNGKVKSASIKDYLHLTLPKYEEPRSAHKLHASDLTNDAGFCPREFSLMRKFNLKRKDSFIDLALRMTFDEGNDKQGRLNNDYLRHIMIGDWVCIRCGHLAEWCRAPKFSCPACGNWKFDYSETRYVHHLTGLSGGIDGIVDLGLSKFRVFESKIMGNNNKNKKLGDFDALLATKAEHRIRTRLYLKLIAESDVPHKHEIDTNKAHIVYLLRGHGVQDEKKQISPIKEFIVERDDSEIQPYIDLAMQLADFDKTGVLPPHKICSTMDCSRAMGCSVSKLCFSGV